MELLDAVQSFESTNFGKLHYHNRISNIAINWTKISWTKIAQITEPYIPWINLDLKNKNDDLIITVLWNERWMKWRMRMESIGGLDEVELLKRKGGEEVKDEGGGCS